MFKFSNNVPEVYMKESRDFQLFPRLDDILFLGCHYDIASITELNNPKKCRSSYLKYLAEKVGFYTNESIPDEVLINIISSFRVALKNKGTEKGIKQAVLAILRSENTILPPELVHIREEYSNYFEQYCINIYTPIKILNLTALKEFLKYIIPAGYTYNIYAYEPYKIGEVSESEYNGVLGTASIPTEKLGVLRDNIKYDINDTNNEDLNIYSNVVTGKESQVQIKFEDRLMNSVISGMVPDGKDLKEILNTIDKDWGKINKVDNDEHVKISIDNKNNAESSSETTATPNENDAD